MQRRVFPKGRPADTAGYSDDPAATQSSVITLNQRLDALERQMTDLLRQSEENSNHLRSLETGIGQLKSDQEQRIQALEQRMTAAETAPAVAAPTGDAAVTTAPAKPKPKPTPTPPKTTADASPAANPGTDVTDPGEDAYSEGFHLWEAGKYDEAISTLKSFVAAYPKH